ncbi:MAG: hypothetical protein ACOH5I_07600 [Oligoflexus sp.]
MDEKIQSALWMVTKEPILNEFVCYLTETKELLLQYPNETHTLEFSREQIQQVKKAFSTMIRKGEAKLHRLCGLFAENLLCNHFDLKSIVIGRLNSNGERFELNRSVKKQEIYSRTDLDLGTWQLSRLRFQSADGWEEPSLVANFVEYQPTVLNPLRVFKMISRIKAEEEIWAKTVDEIFQIDLWIKRDKSLEELSFFIKDVFGIKLVVNTNEDVERLLSRLLEVEWTSEELAKHRVPFSPETQKLHLIELKNHLGSKHQKASGWQALKAVFSWWDKTFEVQIQTVDIYFREQEYLTRESHAGFKERREKIRQELAQKIPLFGFYMNLLQWLFIAPEREPPQLAQVKVKISD